MRDFLSDALFFLGYIVGFVLAGWWIYFIWGLDWGTSSRGRGLMGMMLGFGAILAFLLGLFAMVSISMWLFPEKGDK